MKNAIKKKIAVKGTQMPTPAAAKKACGHATVKKSNVLLERTHKIVTKDGDSVLKIFGPEYKVSAILNEAMNEARAAETGLPVAKVLEVMKLRDHWCIRREWIEGETLADVMIRDRKNLTKYLKQFVAIQCEIFTKTSERMGNLSDKLDKLISASPLPKEIRYDLHMKLQSLPRGKVLCHGDFNPTNVIITPKGDWRVIDWSHVRLGDPLADIAHTYLLLWLSGYIVGAEKYMTIACEALNAKVSNVQKWLPIVAASQSVKGKEEEREFLLKWANVVDYE
jgi:aminoglycoside phosphotransferase